MFGILADTFRTAVLGNREFHHGDWPRSERRFRTHQELEAELRRNPYAQFRDFSG